MLGKLLQLLRFPGLVQPLEDYMIGGHTISVRTSEFYTVIAVDGNELFFTRETGHFDGWGQLKKGDGG